LKTGNTRRICVGSLLLLASVILINIPAVALAAVRQAVGWSQPVALSPDTQSSWFPDIAADAAGRVHVAWSTTLSAGVGRAYDVVMYAAAPSGAPWPSPQDIIALPSKGAVTRPTLLADGQGLLHLTFRSYTLFYSHTPIQSVEPATLLSARPISTVDNGYFSRLAIDKQGRLHIVYSENIQSPSCTGCFHIFYRQSDDKGLTWAPAVDISRLPTGAAKPQLVIDEASNLHVVWEMGAGGDLGQLDPSLPTGVYYTASYDRGQSWSAPLALASFPSVAPTAAPATSTPSATKSSKTATAQPRPSPTAPLASPTPNAPPVLASFKNITLGRDGQGNLVAAWLALPEDRVYFQVSANQGHAWSGPQLLPGVWGAWTVYQGRTDDYAMVTDGAGVVHLVFVGRTAQNDTALSVLHVTWDGLKWGQPEAVVTLTGDVPEWPRAAVGLGNDLHVVWFVRDQAHIFGGQGASLYRVWYAHEVLPAPAITAVVWPTLAPTLSPGVTPATAANPSPGPTLNLSLTPTATPGAVAKSNLVYNEIDYLKVIATGLIPAVLIIFVVVAAVLIFRR
jgi:hypothetical protein